jgi:serine/threonine protein kinase
MFEETTEVMQICNSFGYEVYGKISSGSYGDVYKATNSEGKKCAIKCVKFSDFMGSMEETDVLMRIRHPNIIDAYDFFISGHKTFFVMPKGKKFTKFIKKSHLEQKKMFAIQAIYAIHYLHYNGYSHCDIKPQNVIIVKDDLKIIDFSLTTFHTTEDVSFATSNYRPPECFTTSERQDNEIESFEFQSQKADMWSLGCLLYYIFEGSNMFIYEDEDSDVLNGIKYAHDNISKFIKNIPDNWKQIILGLLRINPDDRYTFEHIFKLIDIPIPKYDIPLMENIIYTPLSDFQKNKSTIIFKKMIDKWYISDYSFRSFSKTVELFYNTIKIINDDELKNFIKGCFYVASSIFDTFPIEYKNVDMIEKIIKHNINRLGSPTYSDFTVSFNSLYCDFFDQEHLKTNRCLVNTIPIISDIPFNIKYLNLCFRCKGTCYCIKDNFNIKNDCFGCLDNANDQKSHAYPGGCLSSKEEQCIEQYLYDMDTDLYESKDKDNELTECKDNELTECKDKDNELTECKDNELTECKDNELTECKDKDNEIENNLNFNTHFYYSLVENELNKWKSQYNSWINVYLKDLLKDDIVYIEFIPFSDKHKYHYFPKWGKIINKNEDIEDINQLELELNGRKIQIEYNNENFTYNIYKYSTIDTLLKKYENKKDILFHCVKNNDYMSLVSLLTNHFVDINLNIIDEHDMSPLAYACKNGNINIAKYIVDKGADINFFGRERPFYYAIDYAHLNIVQWLIELRVDPNVFDIKRKPLDYRTVNCDIINELLLDYIRDYNRTKYN